MEQTFKVPIRNLFYLLSYANDLPDMIDSLNKVEDELITYDFLVELFHREVIFLMQRGLVKSYVSKEEETSSISGRLLMEKSLIHQMRRKPVVVCEKDQYTEDILLNQMMKTTLENIYRNKLVSDSNRKRSYFLSELCDTSTIYLTKEMFMRIHFHRYNMHYKRMIHIAYLFHELELLSHKSGNRNLFTAKIEDKDLNTIFEKFLFHFYRLEQNEFRVTSERMNWKLQGNKKYLPQMLTDVSLTHKKGLKKMVIDAKFYKNMFQIYYDKTSFNSSNLYQMFTYLNHQPIELKQLKGVLIYPYNGEEISEIYQWDERMTLEIMTINLHAKWDEIKKSLLAVLI